MSLGYAVIYTLYFTCRIVDSCFGVYDTENEALEKIKQVIDDDVNWTYNEKINSWGKRGLASLSVQNIVNANDLCEGAQFLFVQKKGSNIQYIETPSEKSQIEAVIQCGQNICYIKNPTYITKIIASLSIGDVNDPDLKLIRERPYNIENIVNPSEFLQIAAVNQEPFSIKYIKNPTLLAQLVAVQRNCQAIEFIDNPDEKVQILAVSKDYFMLSYIKNPSKDVVITALRKNGLAIQWVKNPTVYEQITAFNSNAYCLSYIEDPCEKILQHLKLNPSLSYLIDLLPEDKKSYFSRN